jgi:hypothetical protein
MLRRVLTFNSTYGEFGVEVEGFFANSSGFISGWGLVVFFFLIEACFLALRTARLRYQKVH